MSKVLFPINEISINLLKANGYVLDPTHVYWYKKLIDDVEIEIQNRDNDLYKKGQVILHCKSACIVDDLSDLTHIFNRECAMLREINNYLFDENERLNRIIDEYEESDNNVK